MRTQAHVAEIIVYFAMAKKSVYAPKELDSLLDENRALWNIPRSYGPQKFRKLLEDKVGLRHIQLISEKSKDISRFIRGKQSNLEIGASLIRGSYFSHQTAALIHSLLEITPRQLFVNKEQSEKPKSNSLSQETLDRAFSSSPRKSNNKYRESDEKDGVEYVIVNGKFTNHQGVELFDHPI